jgi:hypothetical protein
MVVLIPFSVTKVDVFVTLRVTKATLLPPRIKSIINPRVQKFYLQLIV